jgi:hypothetical protein
MTSKLKSYEFLFICPVKGGEHKTVYELTILKTSFFGLIKKEVKMRYDISMFADIKEYESHWNELIKSKSEIEKL